MKLVYSKHNILRGAIIYASGDTIAAFILDEFSILRLLGMVMIGATFYAFEIPNYFAWIDKKTQSFTGWKLQLYKTSLAILYFNPLWISRHLLFIILLTGQSAELSWDLIRIGALSFLVNIPLSIIANYIIQNVIRLKWRFFSSAIFSALMAIYYALSVVLFK
ncbi:MAG: hypothetical protein HN352_03720 [Bacteroidetes bacterium]|nr:hypothetical protein [Bacteroidota bacterium]MBT4400636.1 hypothetical protein [Bacteroidota bacterium]MBT4408388.1 hypothetical protein [Bacteroidota bacterium]MBT5427989.1 hypothetical protein [Bacteroidota bacterium]MBT7091782.1 hypothetical protein [Bacteroidota bacterium]